LDIPTLSLAFGRYSSIKIGKHQAIDQPKQGLLRDHPCCFLCPKKTTATNLRSWVKDKSSAGIPKACPKKAAAGWFIPGNPLIYWGFLKQTPKIWRNMGNVHILFKHIQ
jgi:hypothetical protein